MISTFSFWISPGKFRHDEILVSDLTCQKSWSTHFHFGSHLANLDIKYSFLISHVNSNDQHNFYFGSHPANLAIIKYWLLHGLAWNCTGAANSPFRSHSTKSRHHLLSQLVASTNVSLYCFHQSISMFVLSNP